MIKIPRQPDYIKLSILLMVLFILSGATSVNAQSSLKPKDLTILFRLYNQGNGDHFYTSSETERNNAVARAGYKDEGNVCNISKRQVSGTRPLFRLYNPKSGDHFYTASRDERNKAIAHAGYRDEGVTGFIFTTKTPISFGKSGDASKTPLFRLYNPNNGDHFYTASEDERNNAIAQAGYRDEGIVGFVICTIMEG